MYNSDPSDAGSGPDHKMDPSLLDADPGRDHPPVSCLSTTSPPRDVLDVAAAAAFRYSFSNRQCDRHVLMNRDISGPHSVDTRRPIRDNLHIVDSIDTTQ